MQYWWLMYVIPNSTWKLNEQAQGAAKSHQNETIQQLQGGHKKVEHACIIWIEQAGSFGFGHCSNKMIMLKTGEWVRE